MITGSGWPGINFQELNMDWIFNVLIPEIKSLKESYDNIQSTIVQVTQQNYDQWRGELQNQMNALATTIQQNNATWQQQQQQLNDTWRQNVKRELGVEFASWSEAQQQQLTSWEHDVEARLMTLVNNFAEDISASEARAKAYADALHSEQAAFIQQQLQQLNDGLQHQLNELQIQINILKGDLAVWKQELAAWQGRIEAENAKFKEEVETDVEMFKADIEAALRQHQEEMLRRFASMQAVIDEQVRLLNARISALTAADISAIDPQTGETENVQFLLRKLFDADSERRGTITAEEYQQLRLTAEEYKSYNYMAIIYSLFSYYLLKIRNWKAPIISYTGDYVRPEELERRLQDYITKAAVDAELADYVQINELNSTLAEYIKTKDMVSYLSTTLENYVTFENLQNTLQDYAGPDELAAFRQELNSKASQQQLAELRETIYNELDNYAKISELPDVSGFITQAEAIDTFVLKEDFENLEDDYTEFKEKTGTALTNAGDELTRLENNKVDKEDFETLDTLVSNINNEQNALYLRVSQNETDIQELHDSKADKLALQTAINDFTNEYNLVIQGLEDKANKDEFGNLSHVVETMRDTMLNEEIEVITYNNQIIWSAIAFYLPIAAESLVIGANNLGINIQKIQIEIRATANRVISAQCSFLSGYSSLSFLYMTTRGINVQKGQTYLIANSVGQKIGELKQPAEESWHTTIPLMYIPDNYEAAVIYHSMQLLIITQKNSKDIKAGFILSVTGIEEVPSLPPSRGVLFLSDAGIATREALQ